MDALELRSATRDALMPSEVRLDELCRRRAVEGAECTRSPSSGLPRTRVAFDSMPMDRDFVDLRVSIARASAS